MPLRLGPLRVYYGGPVASRPEVRRGRTARWPASLTWARGPGRHLFGKCLRLGDRSWVLTVATADADVKAAEAGTALRGWHRYTGVNTHTDHAHLGRLLPPRDSDVYEKLLGVLRRWER